MEIKVGFYIVFLYNQATFRHYINHGDLSTPSTVSMLAWFVIGFRIVNNR